MGKTCSCTSYICTQCCQLVVQCADLTAGTLHETECQVIVITLEVHATQCIYKVIEKSQDVEMEVQEKHKNKMQVSPPQCPNKERWKVKCTLFHLLMFSS